MIAWILACAAEPPRFEPRLDPQSVAETIPLHELDPYVAPAVTTTPGVPWPGGPLTVHYRGELADRDELVMHYGFNGWNHVDHPGLVESGTTWDRSWAADLEMRRVDGGFDADLVLPPEARVVHMAFAAGTTWDNNGRQDHNVSVTFPFAGPWLTPTGEPGEMVVSWETDLACLGAVEHGPTSALGLVAVGEVADEVHHVALEGLEPGATWWYRVRDSAGRASEVHGFRVPGDERTLDALVFSDVQWTGDDGAWPAVAALMGERQDTDLLVIAGDIVPSDAHAHWWTFFDGGRDLFARLPLLVSTGNHDSPTANDTVRGLFPQPWATGAACAVDVGPTRWLALDSQREDEVAPGGEQYAFAEAALADARAADGPDWTFAFFHHPAYNVGRRHAAEQDEVRPLTALFDGRVDWVFGAHEHLAQRYVPLRHDATVAPTWGEGEADGVGYLGLPTAAQTPQGALVDPAGPEGYVRALVAWPPFAPADTAVPSELGWATVHVDGWAIELEVWAAGTPGAVREPRVLHRVAYEKPPR